MIPHQTDQSAGLALRRLALHAGQREEDETMYGLSCQIHVTDLFRLKHTRSRSHLNGPMPRFFTIHYGEVLKVSKGVAHW